MRQRLRPPPTHLCVNHETERKLDVALVRHRLLVERVLERYLSSFEETCTGVSKTIPRGKLIFHFRKRFGLVAHNLDERDVVIALVPPKRLAIRNFTVGNGQASRLQSGLSRSAPSSLLHTHVQCILQRRQVGLKEPAGSSDIEVRAETVNVSQHRVATLCHTEQPQGRSKLRVRRLCDFNLLENFGQ